MDIHRIATAIASEEPRTIVEEKVVITDIFAEVYGKANDEDFECEIEWDFATGKVAHFKQKSGPSLRAEDILAYIKTNDSEGWLEVSHISAMIIGTVNNEEFKCQLEWDPSTGDVADFDQESGPEVIPTDLLVMIGP